MEREFLEKCLAESMSLEKIGALVGKDPTTVGYHLKKHGLKAVNHDRNAPKHSPVDEVDLRKAVGEGASLSELAAEFDRSVSSIRYWLKKYGLLPSRLGRRRAESIAAREAGIRELERVCARHGVTTFILESRGYYRCLRCRREAVVNWRRRVKERLIERAGGRCELCGYSRYQGALQFHHLDPETKSFVISREGTTRSYAEVEAEVDKCVLLCANCHAEVEAGVATIPPTVGDSSVGRALGC